MKWEAWVKLANDEIYWQGRTEKGLLKAEYSHDYVLHLWFDDDGDVSLYELDFYPLFVTESPGEVFLPLRDKNRFRLVKGDYALIWPNPETWAYDSEAIDLAPECVRFFCEQYGKVLKSTKQAALVAA